MNKINAVKLVARTLVGAGTTTISKSIIQNNVNPSNKIETISVVLASVVIGSMASEATKSHTDAKIDAIAAAFTTKTESTDATVTA